MSVRQDDRVDATTGKVRKVWVADVDYRHPDRTRKRVRQDSPVQTRRGAEHHERKLRRDIQEGCYDNAAPPIPTFSDWFNGRFWQEWVVAEKNKPSEIESKKSIFKVHLRDEFGSLRLNEIGVPEIKRFKANLIQRISRTGKPLSDKRINNILAVLSKALKYAEEAKVITHAPKVGLLMVERPEIEPWSFEEYVRVVSSARRQGTRWLAAVAIAGEAGLRVGEVKELRWREDVDMVARSITVTRQRRRNVVGSPKGRKRRVIPMTPLLYDALKSISTVHEGLILCRTDGTPLSDGQCHRGLARICRLADLRERPWHVLRHTFATHAAQFGVNPWTLRDWMGHKRIEETLLYVSYVSGHRRPVPEHVVRAAVQESDPDMRILRMLGARAAGNLDPTLTVGRQAA